MISVLIQAILPTFSFRSFVLMAVNKCAARITSVSPNMITGFIFSTRSIFLFFAV